MPGTCSRARTAPSFSTHGLYLKAGRRSTHTLYAVHHGGRESIEVFTFDAGTTPPAVTWVGCVVAPDPIGLNAVVALPDGGFAATNFDPRPPSGAPAPGVSAKVLSGDWNGEVWEWHPKTGWAKVPGSEGFWRERHRALGGRQAVLRRRVGQSHVHAAVTREDAGRTEGDFAGIPRRQPSLVARREDAPRRRTGTRTRRVAAGDGARDAGLDHRPHRPAGDDCTRSSCKESLPPGVFAATVAIEVGDDYWAGSFRGNRITRYRIAAGK